MRTLLAMSTLLSSLFPGVAAQSSSYASSVASSASSSAPAASSSTSGAKVHRVNVGSGGFSYDPNTTYADVGDIVTFVFYPTNHSVIRAEYTGSDACGAGGCNPCTPYELIHGDGGFHSGNVLLQTPLPDPKVIKPGTKTWNLTITNTDPIFFYCNAVGSCHPNGMVGVINPNELVSLQKQKDAAKSAPYQLAPGEPWPAEGAQPGAETATVSGLSQPTSTTSNGQSNNGGSHRLSGGAIAGIAIGAVAILLLAAALFYFIGRSKTYKDMFKASKSETAGNASTTGENVAQWNPPPGGAPSSTSYPDNRFSHMTYNSQATAPSDATFVGYNRNTGAPEFANEAPGAAQYHSPHASPLPHQQSFAHSPPTKNNTFEMPGDIPAPQEKQ